MRIECTGSWLFVQGVEYLPYAWHGARGWRYKAEPRCWQAHYTNNSLQQVGQMCLENDRETHTIREEGGTCTWQLQNKDRLWTTWKEEGNSDPIEIHCRFKNKQLKFTSGSKQGDRNPGHQPQGCYGKCRQADMDLDFGRNCENEKWKRNIGDPEETHISGSTRLQKWGRPELPETSSSVLLDCGPL